MRDINRRDFLRTAGSGIALLSLPPVLASCAGPTCAVKPAASGGAHATYFDAFGVDAGRLRRVIGRGLSRGGEFAEVYLQHKITHWVGLEDGQVNRAFTQVDLGAGIRVLQGDATGFAYSEDLSEPALLSAAETAAAVASAGGQGTPAEFSRAAHDNPYPVEVPWSEVGVDKKVPVLERVDRGCRAKDPRIIKVISYLTDEFCRILVANSEGLLVEDDQPMAVLSASCVAEHNGRTETSGHSLSARDGMPFLSEATIGEVVRRAAEYTLLLFDAGPAPVGELPVVLAPGVPGILLHEAMGHGFEADFNRKGISIYANRIGERIAPAGVTILDDGSGKIRGSVAIDDEGTPTQKTVLVEDGVLRSYLHDRISARHYKLASTGSGRRESFRFPPVPRMRNTYMLAGKSSPEEIIGSVKRGLYAEMFSNGQVNIGAGDFTFYLKHGRLIEDGKLQGYVKDANLIGSGPKVLAAVEMIGNDLEIVSGGSYCGKDGQRVPVGFGLPTLKVGAISIGGRSAS
jgi:TldD protein